MPIEKTTQNLMKNGEAFQNLGMTSKNTYKLECLTESFDITKLKYVNELQSAIL